MRNLIVAVTLILMGATPAGAEPLLVDVANSDTQSVGGSNVNVIKDKARDDACSGGHAATGLLPALAIGLLVWRRRRAEDG